MAQFTSSARGIEDLPDEILLSILSFLDEHTIITLQLVSRKFRTLCSDNNLWQGRCFDRSPFLANFRYRRMLLESQAARSSAQSAAASSHSPPDETAHEEYTDPPDPPVANSKAFLAGQGLRTLCRITEKQLRANWDPSYPGEGVSWYDEYIQRYGPARTNWFQSPRVGGSDEALNEVRGLGLLRPRQSQRGYTADEIFAVSPLEDGTVCLFDVRGSRVRKGAVLAMSRPGLLFCDGSGSDNTSRSRKINSGVTECVSVDNQCNRAFFAVQSHLMEVDLSRLEVVSQQHFEWSITTLSEASPRVPLTVGTSLGLHLYDYRAPRAYSPQDTDHDNRLDRFSQIFSNDPLPAYAPLSQPTPLFIHHLPEAGSPGDAVSNDVYVAGRFPSILWYDRRKWPRILGSIHSGAQLSSLASVPYPFLSDVHRRRWGEVPSEQLLASKAARGHTLLAGGEYKTKGSLELIGLRSPAPGKNNRGGGGGGVTGWMRSQKPWTYVQNSVVRDSVLQNRQMSSSSKILSVITHGTRIVVSDGCGDVKWFERDGLTEVRRHKIGSPEKMDPSQPSIFAQSDTGEIARKLLSTQSGQDDRVNEDDIVFWTGDRLGMIDFKQGEGFTADDFEEIAKGLEGQRTEEERHSWMMRRALEMHADEMRLTRNLVFGRE